MGIKAQFARLDKRYRIAEKGGAAFTGTFIDLYFNSDRKLVSANFQCDKTGVTRRIHPNTEIHAI